MPSKPVFSFFRLLVLFAVVNLASWSPPLLAQTAPSQTTAQPVLEALQAAFANRNSQQVLVSAADRISITLFGASNTYSRDQASFVLDGFFETYPPEQFVFQTPRMKEGYLFTSGVYRVAQDENPLYIYVRMHQQGTHWELQEIRIQRRPFR